MSNLKGGPRTQQGKSVSSRNSTKIGLYTSTLLEGEDANALEELMESLIEQWGLSGAQAELLAREYVYCDLKSARILRAQLEIVESQMHMSDTRHEFARQAGISVLIQDKLPQWYFDGNVSAQQLAIEITNSVEEAGNLMGNFSLQASLQARTLYPNLWRQVMGPNAINPKQTMGERLLAKFGSSRPEQNLLAYIEHCQKHKSFELMWGVFHERYQGVLKGLRAKLMLEAMSRADWAKVDSAQHKRRFEIIQMVHAIRRETDKREHPTIELASPPQVIENSAPAQGQSHRI